MKMPLRMWAEFEGLQCHDRVDGGGVAGLPGSHLF